MAHKNKEQSITVRSSVFCVRILKLLQQEGVILSFTLLSAKNAQDVGIKYVKVYLKYFNDTLLLHLLMLYLYRGRVNTIL